MCKWKVSVFLSQNFSVNSFNGSDSWVILSPIEQSIKAKIEKVGTPLKDWDINIYRGVLTGCNEAFIISTEKRNEILENCKNEDERKRTAELIRPILRGRDIKRYSYDWANLWLVYIPWHFPLHLDNSIQGCSEKAEKEFQKQYPAIYNHLLGYKKQLSARNKAETGIRYEWYALQRWGANYWEDFFKPKIMYAEIVQEPKFYLDKKNFLPEATSFLLTGENLEYLVKVFNSKITAYLFKTFYAGGGLGEAGFRYKKAFFENLPIPRIDKQQIQSVEKSNNDEEISIQLGKIYGFSPTEIDFIARKLKTV